MSFLVQYDMLNISWFTHYFNLKRIQDVGPDEITQRFNISLQHIKVLRVVEIY